MKNAKSCDGLGNAGLSSRDGLSEEPSAMNWCHVCGKLRDVGWPTYMCVNCTDEWAVAYAARNKAAYAARDESDHAADDG